MAFIEELKQRKVVRVAVAYLVVAWLGVQVASIALPAFEAPGWVLRVLILVLALGFPFALMLTWAVDLTPDGPRYSPGGTGFKRMVAISAALGALALGWYFFGQPAWRGAPPAASPASAGKPAASPAAAAPTKGEANARSIAVLPFVNMSGDPGNEYFSDGLAETTLDMLAQVHDLKVIARTSSFAFKGKNSDVREIGRALDAAHLLEGSVQQAGQMVRITAQLIRTRDGTHLWSGKYDRKLTDVFAIQDEIAGEVVKALQLALPATEQQRLTGKRTANVAAYQQYLRGNALLPGRQVAGMRRALAHFEQAIALDPGYADAYAGAALTLGLLNSYAGSGSGDADKRRRYIARALQLEPALGEAYAARAGLMEEEHDLAGAEENYRRAIALSPNFATAYQWYGEFLMNQLGESARALPMFQRALELDPLSPMIRNEHAFAQAVNGDENGALASLAQLLREHPEFAPGHRTRATILSTRGDLVGALRGLDAQDANDPAANRRIDRCMVLLRYSAVAEAQACFAAIGARPDDPRAVGARTLFLLAQGKLAEADAAARQARQPEPWDAVQLDLALGRFQQALTRLQALDPGMFIQPVPKLQSSFPGDAMLAGAALIGTGARAQGRDLVQRGLKANASKPHLHVMYGRGWSDAYGWGLLGDMERACAALREAVAAGHFLDLPSLDHSRLVPELSKQPCYGQALAPARAKAAAQVEAARKAGLL